VTQLKAQHLKQLHFSALLTKKVGEGEERGGGVPEKGRKMKMQTKKKKKLKKRPHGAAREGKGCTFVANPLDDQDRGHEKGW